MPGTIIQFLPSPNRPQMSRMERPENLAALCGLAIQENRLGHLATGMISVVGIQNCHLALSAKGFTSSLSSADCKIGQIVPITQKPTANNGVTSDCPQIWPTGS